MKHAEYLGDGVYASLREDGSIVITAGHHDPNHPHCDEKIYMEPEVLIAFMRWLEKLPKKIEPDLSIDPNTQSKFGIK